MTVDLYMFFVLSSQLLANFPQSKKQVMVSVRVDLAKLRIKTRRVKVKLEKIRVGTRPVQVKVRKQGIALRGVRVLLRKERLQMRRVVVRVAKVSLEEQPAAAAVNEEEDFNDLTLDVSLRREIPTWARTANYMTEARKQEEIGRDALLNIFAPVNLDELNLEEKEIFKVPAKTPKRPRNFSLDLNLSNFEFDPEAWS